jgi:hypothetical protein
MAANNVAEKCDMAITSLTVSIGYSGTDGCIMSGTSQVQLPLPMDFLIYISAGITPTQGMSSGMYLMKGKARSGMKGNVHSPF